MKIKAIFLDFYGTLVHEDDEIIPIICQKIKDSSNLNVELDEIGKYWWNVFYDLFSKSYGDNFKTQRELEMLSLQCTLEHFSSTENSESLSQILYNHWQKPKIFEDTKEFLKNFDLPICIVSNIDTKDINSAIDFHNFKFTKILTSEDAKSYKPRKELFELALKEMNLNQEEVIHIGDSINSDIEGSKNIGIKSIWINRKNKKNTNVVIKYSCNNLLEVEELLKKIEISE